MFRTPDVGPYRVAAPDEAALADREEIESFGTASRRSRRRARALALAALLAGIGSVALSIFAVARPRPEPVVVPRVPVSYEPLPPPGHNCVTSVARCNYEDCYERFEGPPPTSNDSPLATVWDGRRGYWLPVDAWRLSPLCTPLKGVPQVPDCDRTMMSEPNRVACRIVEGFTSAPTR